VASLHPQAGGLGTARSSLLTFHSPLSETSCSCTSCSTGSVSAAALSLLVTAPPAPPCAMLAASSSCSCCNCAARRSTCAGGRESDFFPRTLVSARTPLSLLSVTDADGARAPPRMAKRQCDRRRDLDPPPRPKKTNLVLNLEHIPWRRLLLGRRAALRRRSNVSRRRRTAGDVRGLYAARHGSRRRRVAQVLRLDRAELCAGGPAGPAGEQIDLLARHGWRAHALARLRRLRRRDLRESLRPGSLDPKTRVSLRAARRAAPRGGARTASLAPSPPHMVLDRRCSSRDCAVGEYVPPLRARGAPGGLRSRNPGRSR